MKHVNKEYIEYYEKYKKRREHELSIIEEKRVRKIETDKELEIARTNLSNAKDNEKSDLVRKFCNLLLR